MNSPGSYEKILLLYPSKKNSWNDLCVLIETELQNRILTYSA